MPEYPTPGGDWTSWIIGTLMAVLSAVVGTAVTLAKMIESKYQKEVAELHEDIEALKLETKECQKDRLSLAVRVASLESNTKALNKNTDAIERNTEHH